MSQRARRAAVARGVLVAACLALGTSADAVVISEIHYNPPLGDESLEFIELANETTTPEDLSGWSFVEGIAFTFPPATILPARGVVVVCADPDAVRSRYGIDGVLGPFAGRLDSGGERIRLANQAGITIQSVRYRDQGAWPVAPDGTGHTLTLQSVYLDPAEPESWTASAELGGSPGRAAFPGGAAGFTDEVIVPAGALWRFRRGTGPFSSPPDAWQGVDFDDSSWSEGASGFGYGDGDDATVFADMQGAFVSFAVRREVELAASDLVDAETTSWVLGVDYDDGFCAFVNGVPIASVNCNPGQLWNETATGSREAGVEELFAIPPGLLREGTNIIALLERNFDLTSSDASLIPRLIQRTREGGGDGPGGGSAKLVFNELYRDGSGGGWVELFQSGTQAADLSGLSLATDPDAADPYRFPAGTIVAPGAYFAVDAAEAGLDLAPEDVRVFLRSQGGRVMTAAAFTEAPPPDLAPGSWSEARFPDGGRPGFITATPTRGAPNEVAREERVILNEVFYHPPGDPVDVARAEWIELHNRSDEAIDLGGFRFSDGIDFTFPAGASIAPRGYAVVSDDPALLLEHYGIDDAFGPFEGKLSNDGERLRLVDRLGNVVDELRWHDGGEWPEWADGDGSSLERIDPRAESDVPLAWEASDESAKAPWERLTYHVSSYRPAGESELHLFFVERGIAHIDDISITRNGGANAIPNPGFESTTSPWRIGGTHIHSERIATDGHGGTACLRLVATGKGDTGVNRIETDTNPALTSGAYDVSIWARWIAGSSLIVSHGEFGPGPYGSRPSPATNLSANTLGGRFRLTVPLALGTPGAENSATARLREERGVVNQGPLVSAVNHEPASPSATDSVTVTCRVTDPDGVADARVYYREDSAAGAFASIALVDDGQHGDGRAGDGTFGGAIPPLRSGHTVVFWIGADDTTGAEGRWPREATDRTAVYLVQGPVQASLDSAQLVLDAQHASELDRRELHSNDLLDGSFVFDNDEIWHQVGARYRGSPWGRPGRTNYRVRFPDDRPFHQGLAAANLSSRGSSPNEGAGYFLVGRNGTPLTPAPTADYRYIQTWINTRPLGTQALVQPVDRDYIQKWYGEDAEGPVLKGVGRLAFDDSGNRTGWDGASFQFMGEEAENYRGYFFHSIEQTRDDWTGLIELCRVMDRGATSNDEFDRRVDDVLDVEAFLRVLAPRILMAGWDALFIGNGHNGYLAFDPRTGLWGLLPFDLDNEFGNAQPGLFPSGDVHTARMLSRPGPRRTYFRILSEYVDGYWSAARAGPWLDRVTADTRVGASGIKGFLSQSEPWVRAQIRSSVDVPFAIRTNDGQPIETEDDSIVLEGTASVRIASILWHDGIDDPEPMAAEWTGPTSWRALFPLRHSVQTIELLGFDGAGELAGTASIRVSSLDPLAPRFEAIFPSRGPSAGGTRVNITGERFESGMEVFFGNAPAVSVTVVNDVLIQASTPPAPDPLPAEGFVDIELRTSRASTVAPRAFVYEGPPPLTFLRGDTNGDGVLDLSDAIATLAYLFLGGETDCVDAADVDDDGRILLTDPIAALGWLFQGGDPPPPPFPAPGVDPTPDALGCER